MKENQKQKGANSVFCRFWYLPQSLSLLTYLCHLRRVVHFTTLFKTREIVSHDPGSFILHKELTNFILT